MIPGFEVAPMQRQILLFLPSGLKTKKPDTIQLYPA
jgi:hypothetical protein